jgi:hypothetical protein
VDLPHFGQSVLLEVSITFLRSAVFAIFAMSSPDKFLRRDSRPQVARLIWNVWGGRATLDWTAEGGCPYAVRGA